MEWINISAGLCWGLYSIYEVLKYNEDTVLYTDLKETAIDRKHILTIVSDYFGR